MTSITAAELVRSFDHVVHLALGGNRYQGMRWNGSYRYYWFVEGLAPLPRD